MSLHLIANTVGDAASGMQVVTNSHVAATKTGVENLKGGPRFLGFTTSVDRRRVAYVNTRGGLEANFMVAVGMDAHDMKEINVLAYSTWTSTASSIFSTASFGETLVGPFARDWVVPLGAQTNKQAFALHFATGSYPKTLKKLYFGQSLEFPYVDERSPLRFRRMPVWGSQVRYRDTYYRLWGEAELAVTNVTDAMKNAYYSLPMDDPVFFYDDSENSRYLPHKLWHCIIIAEDIIQRADNAFDMTFKLGLLEDY